MGRAEVIQIRQNNFLQDKNFYNLQNFFSFRLFSLSIPQLLNYCIIRI